MIKVAVLFIIYICLFYSYDVKDQLNDFERIIRVDKIYKRYNNCFDLSDSLYKNIEIRVVGASFSYDSLNKKLCIKSLNSEKIVIGLISDSTVYNIERPLVNIPPLGFFFRLVMVM